MKLFFLKLFQKRHLHELQNMLEQTTGTCICVAAIDNFLKHQQFSQSSSTKSRTKRKVPF